MATGEQSVRNSEAVGQASPPTSGVSGTTGPSGATATPINPAALTVAQAAKLLGVAEQTIRSHVSAGLPTGLGGTINLVMYAAWLNRQLKDRDAD